MTEFAYVTDGACGVADILDMELLICKVWVVIIYVYCTWSLMCILRVGERFVSS